MFYLADTVWAAFANATLEEWEEYLEYRKMQNFNVLQISILPLIHDSSDSNIGLMPFEMYENGNFDFYRINDAYFERAKIMVDMAVKRGFIPGCFFCFASFVLTGF